MAWPMWVYYVIQLAVAAILAYALRPKPIKEKPKVLGDFNYPTCQYGRPNPWLFGRRWKKDGNCVVLTHLGTQTETQDHVKVKFYSLGMVLELGRGPYDAIVRAIADEDLEKVWYSYAPITENSLINVDLPNLFGGREGEGGIVGPVRFQFGLPDQARNAYLVGRLGLPQTAYRDSMTVVYESVLLTANNPTLKPHAFLAERVFADWEGYAPGECWYPERARVAVESVPLSYDNYVRGLEGGPALAYWWPLNSDFSAGPEANSGTATGGGSMVLQGTLGGVSYNVDAIVQGTDDEGALQRGGAPNSWLTVPDVAIDGTVEFSVIWWGNLQGSGEQRLYSSNVGGSQGHWRGLDIYIPGGATCVHLVLGDGAGQYIRYKTDDGTFDVNALQSIVVYCRPSFTIEFLELECYVNGALEPLTYAAGSATAVDWPTGPSDFDGWTGMAFDGPGDTYGAFSEGIRDQLGFTFGRLTEAQIAELDRRGRGAFEDSGDMNPAHAIYQMLTDTADGDGEPAASLNDAAFRYCADVCHAEGMGVSFDWATAGRPITEAIEMVMAHAGLMLSLDIDDLTITLVPLRDDYDVEDLELFTDDDIEEVIDWQEVAEGESVNEITGIFNNRAAFEREDPVVGHNLASIQETGRSTETRHYPCFATQQLCARAVLRDLKNESPYLKRGKIRFKRGALRMVPGKVFRLSSVNEQIDELVVRVLEWDRGEPGDASITMTIAQDIHTLDDSAYVIQQGNEYEPPNTAPVAPEFATVLEMPYWWVKRVWGPPAADALTDEVGYGFPLAVQPQPLSDAFQFEHNRNSNLFNDLEIIGTADWSRTAVLAADIVGDDNDITIEDADLGTLTVGRLLQVGEGRDAEIIRYNSGNGVTAMNVGRGRLDTTPARLWPAGTRLWLLPQPQMPDEMQFEDGDTLEYRVMTIAPGGVLDSGQATVTAEYEFQSRLGRPIPPGRVRIGSDTVSFPTAVSGTFTVTWEDRHRHTQSDGTNQSGQDIPGEPGVTYSWFAYDDDTDALLDSITGTTDNEWTPSIGVDCTVRLEGFSVRDGLDCWQPQVRVFDYSSTDFMGDASGDYDATASGDLQQEA